MVTNSLDKTSELVCEVILEVQRQGNVGEGGGDQGKERERERDDKFHNFPIAYKSDTVEY